MNKPLHPCNQPGCHETTKERYCERHKKTHYKTIDDRRGTPAERGYDKEWQRIRRIVLMEEPLCRLCKEDGRVTASQVVDHIDGNSFNNERSNLRGLCKHCHDTRTARDQAFGRKGRS